MSQIALDFTGPAAIPRATPDLWYRPALREALAWKSPDTGRDFHDELRRRASGRAAATYGDIQCALMFAWPTSYFDDDDPAWHPENRAAHAFTPEGVKYRFVESDLAGWFWAYRDTPDGRESISLSDDTLVHEIQRLLGLPVVDALGTPVRAPRGRKQRKR